MVLTRTIKRSCSDQESYYSLRAQYNSPNLQLVDVFVGFGVVNIINICLIIDC